MTYCEYVADLPSDDLHRKYHDTQYGFPIHNDNELFGRLILEINQAGLSWNTILMKQENFRKAYEQFDVRKVSVYGESDIKRLLEDSGIIRNRLKINAAITNANRIVEIQSEFGSFEKWLEQKSGLTLEEWVKLFKQNFKFVGGEIVNEFLMSVGLLPGAHDKNCPIYKKLA